MRAWKFIVAFLVVCVVGVGFWKAMRVHASDAMPAESSLTDWSPQEAAKYLDYREEWWQGWGPAQKDHGTICVSCHTGVPYALARPLLQKDLAGATMPAAEKTMLASVEKRVSDWSEMTPYYSDALDGPGMTAESHATEAVLNAAILASGDAGQEHLRSITQTALHEAWALQEQTGENAGGWKWQDFGLEPWESADSGYQGAAILAIALGNAPNDYAEPDTSKHLEMLRDYLRREYAVQPLMSKVYILWASARMPGLMDEAERTRLVAELRNLQHSDGGWALSSLYHSKFMQILPGSDGCATGLVVLALEESGMSRQDKMLENGLEWLDRHQQKDGSWHASSLNTRSEPNSETGLFMSDAATGYAVLALDEAKKDKSGSSAPLK
jgi:squalene-hopene/tetraprenyl-beta-curcumene cyclase